MVAKFYRPGRWSDAAIREEHAFAAELAAQEIPVVAPLAREGETLHFHRGFRYAVFPRRGGRWPELGTRTSGSGWAGFWAESTRSGAVRPFRDRAASRRRGARACKSRDFVLDGDWLPDYLAPKYADRHR